MKVTLHRYLYGKTHWRDVLWPFVGPIHTRPFVLVVNLGRKHFLWIEWPNRKWDRFESRDA